MTKCAPDPKAHPQTQTWYDPAGRPVATATFQRLPDDTTTAGPLDATDAYATAAATFYDAVGRTVEQVNYGREDTASGLPHNFFDATTGQLINVNGDGIPDAAQGIPPAPNSSDGYSVVKTVYDPRYTRQKRCQEPFPPFLGRPCGRRVLCSPRA